MSQMDLDDERSLVARLRAGDTGAFDDAYRGVSAQGVLLSAADEPQSNSRRGSLGRNVAPAGQVCEESSARHAYRTVALHRCAQSVLELSPKLTRGGSVGPRAAGALAVSDTLAVAVRFPRPPASSERRVEIALGTLSPHHREALLLVAHEGLTPGEAAVACGVTAEAFRQRLSRARAALMEQLEKTPGSILQRRYGT